MPRSSTSARLALPLAASASLVAHPAIGLLYELTRPPPRPRLTVELTREGEGTGVVTASPIDWSCGADQPRCSVELATAGTVTLRATIGERSIFLGWGDRCGPQSPRLFAWAAAFAAPDAGRRPALAAVLSGLAARPLAEDPMTCTVAVERATTVTAGFGEQPDHVDVAWIADRVDDEVALPRLAPPDKPRPVAPPPEAPVELALVPPPPAPKLEPPPPPPPDQPKPRIEKSSLKSVEVADDQHEVDRAPDDAAFLSDKNRKVTEQTVAKDTNLEREQTGERPPSTKSEVSSSEVGGAEDEIAQLETSEASSLEAERREETARSGKATEARGVETGTGGEDGDGGKPGMLSMRGIEGRGALGGPVFDGPGAAKPGESGSPLRPGRRGRRGIQTQLAFEDYDRIVGHDAAKHEVEVARRTASARKGRFEKKLAAIKSSLENFTSEVKTGNQTALNTRAAPFAVFLARMHRKIHELWGFGFLEELDAKPASDPLNDWTLVVKLEIVVEPDGAVETVNIVDTSRLTTFDVAAIDTVLTAAPFDAPPPEIRSPDGKTYVHWSFHRDWRQCGTEGAEPFILAAPRGADRGAALPSPLPTRQARGGGGRPRPAASYAAADDPEAARTASLWLTAFSKRDVGAMVGVSGVPFAAGSAVARSGAEVARLYALVLSESPVRSIDDHRLVSAAGYRKLFGELPAGLESAGGELFLVVRVAGERFTVQLRGGPGGGYQAVGLFR